MFKYQQLKLAVNVKKIFLRRCYMKKNLMAVFILCSYIVSVNAGTRVYDCSNVNDKYSSPAFNIQLELNNWFSSDTVNYYSNSLNENEENELYDSWRVGEGYLAENYRCFQSRTFDLGLRSIWDNLCIEEIAFEKSKILINLYEISNGPEKIEGSPENYNSFYGYLRHYNCKLRK